MNLFDGEKQMAIRGMSNLFRLFSWPSNYSAVTFSTDGHTDSCGIADDAGWKG